jgi:hypothetical protein
MNTTTAAVPQDVRLVSGVGDRGMHTACLVSLAGWLNGDHDHSDTSECVCPSIRELAIQLNDGAWWDDDAERTAALIPLAARIMGTNHGPELAGKRRALTMAWLRTFVVPHAFEAAAGACERRGFLENASKLREQAKSVADGGSFEDARRIAAAYAYAAYAAAAAYAANAEANADAAYAAAAAYAANAEANADAAYAAAVNAIRRNARKPMRDALKAHIEALCEVAP